MKAAPKVIYLPVLLLLVAYVLKLAVLPNQLLFIGAAWLCMFFCLLYFLKQQLSQSQSGGQQLWHILFFLLALLFIVLPFAGMFQQGLLPLGIYTMMAISLLYYFIKWDAFKPAIHNFWQATYYRNFVWQCFVGVLLNAPFQNVLPDRLYTPQFTPRYATGQGPVIYIDGAHHNYHTADHLYTACANVLRQDGYSVRPFTQSFSGKSLAAVQILLISNALHANNVNSWQQPVDMAFTDQEVYEMQSWVSNGGSLFLIADHMPFSSAAKNLAAAFGFGFYDGFALKRVSDGKDMFCRERQTLLENEISNGHGPNEYVDSIITFVGQAFSIPDSAVSILNFSEEYAMYSPQIAWNFKGCKSEDITGFSQAAYMKYGKGRIIVFGEAAMFSAQYGAGLSWVKVGMNSTEARNNYKLLLNCIHWLDPKK